ncbi:MAG: hypothetical protein O2816_02610 [Planctomycetota bacterium]|nr:hypothetical protein [Planctomycetota bacterium]
MRSILLPIASLAAVVGVVALLPQRRDEVLAAASGPSSLALPLEDSLAPRLGADSRTCGAPQAPSQDQRLPGARLSVRVIDQRSDPVVRAPVLLRGEGQPDTMLLSDLEGRAVFAGLDAGEYVVGIADERARGDASCDHGLAALPRGYWFDEDRQISLLLESQDRRAQNLVCERGAVLYGSLSAVDGSRGHGCVHARSGMRDRAGRAWEAEADPRTGSFCLTVPPGHFMVSFHAPPPWDSQQPPNPWSDLVGPPPVMLTLGPGQSVNLDRVFGVVEGTRITGSIIDQREEAWSLDACLYLQSIMGNDRPGSRFTTSIHTVATDERGAFELGPVPPGKYGVTFAQSDQDQAGPGGLAEYPAPLLFEVAGEESLDLGPQLVYRWEPLTVTGKLLVGENLGLRQVQVEVLVPSVQPAGEPMSKPLRILADGTFTLATTSHKPGVLTFRMKGPSGVRERVLEILPSEDPIEITLRYL